MSPSQSTSDRWTRVPRAATTASRPPAPTTTPPLTQSSDWTWSWATRSPRRPRSWRCPWAPSRRGSGTREPCCSAPSSRRRPRGRATDMREDDRLSEALRRVPVPEHGPDYRMRREQALAGAQPTTTGQGATQEALARRRTVARRVLVAAVAAVGLVAVVAGAVVSTRDAVDRTRSTPLQSPSPSTSPARHSAIVAGAAPTLVGDDLTAVVRGLDGTLWAWGYRHRQGGPGSPLLERWDGSSWQEVALPARRANEIEGVAAISEDDVWVAGNSRRAGSATSCQLLPSQRSKSGDPGPPW